MIMVETINQITNKTNKQFLEIINLLTAILEELKKKEKEL